MEQYRDSIKNAKVENSLASAKGYSITVHSDDTTYHRKSYIEDGKELFYEMTYPTNSEKSSEYKKYAEYMDEYFRLYDNRPYHDIVWNTYIDNAENRHEKYSLQQLGDILKEMYSNAEDKMQVASIHIFGIKYGKNIIENEFFKEGC